MPKNKEILEDAARYRYLRDHLRAWQGAGDTVHIEAWVPGFYTNQSLDSIVDSTMAKEAKSTATDPTSP